MAGITLLETDAADIPTPATDKATIFLPVGDVPSYKDDAGAVFPLGTTGPQGPPATSYFPGGWL